MNMPSGNGKFRRAFIYLLCAMLSWVQTSRSRPPSATVQLPLLVFFRVISPLRICCFLSIHSVMKSLSRL